MGALALTLLAVVLTASPAIAKGGEKVFLDSAIEVTETEVTLPLFEGRVGDETVWFIITEASDGGVADDLGVNKFQKLENARGSGAVPREPGATLFLNSPYTESREAGATSSERGNGIRK